ncbi:hypothetical protein DFH09DRAFT_1319388 [Mycena vulgaris]|nr:hypothetical protein DFH09DRAFT_1319388 [Mycena vulgaris]
MARRSARCFLSIHPSARRHFKRSHLSRLSPSRTYPSQVIKCVRFKSSNTQALSSFPVFAVGERKIVQASTVAHVPQGMSAFLKLSSLKSSSLPVGLPRPPIHVHAIFSLRLVYLYIRDMGFMNTVDDVLPQRTSCYQALAWRYQPLPTGGLVSSATTATDTMGCN